METTQRTDDPTGITLDNGATVLTYGQEFEAAPGWRRSGIALCYWASNTYTPYVTWRLIQDEQGEWFAEAGVYHRAITTAADCYRERMAR